MQDEIGHSQGHQTYLVTLDVAEKIASFETIGIKAPSSDDGFFQRIHADLISAVETALGPEVTVKVVRMSDLANDVLGHAYKTRKSEGSLIVSTCREFAEPMKGVTLDINRLVDRYGVSLGIGPRPGYPSIDEQLRIIKAHANNRPVVIVEDGIFSGGTVEFVVDRCSEAGIEVNQVVVGFRFPSSQDRIDVLAERGVEVSWLEEFGELLDWVPDHDFLPMVPNCGRILGVAPFDAPVPYYSHRGMAYSMPYVHPFSPVEDWAGVPEGSKRELAKACFSLTQQIYTKLDLINGYEIRIEEVVRAPQPVTLPIKVGGGRIVMPEPRQSVSAYLNELSHSFASSIHTVA